MTRKKIKALLLVTLLFNSLLISGRARAERDEISAGAVGLGNFIVPGLGATLRDKPAEGLKEAGIEIGSFYGGTLLAPEKRFRIDGTIDLPDEGRIGKAAVAQTLQQFGLKYHFYNTFYHYQQVARDNADTDQERGNPQPLYEGTSLDSFKAPFEWENLSSSWVWPVILGGAIYLTYDYAHGSVDRRGLALSPGSEALYSLDIVGVNPIGSYMGEDPFFRGFMQREIIGHTGSVPLAIGTQSALFSILHENRPNAFVVGVYLGLVTFQNHGDLRKSMAIHFWLDMLDGLYTYFRARRSAGLSAPLNPPLTAQMTFPF